MKHNYTIIFSSGNACAVPIRIRAGRFTRRRNPEFLARGLAPSELAYLKSLQASNKPWSRYVGMPWNRFLTMQSPKAIKSMSHGVATAVLHLAPFDASGKNVCIFATPGCQAGCLHTAGRGGISGSKREFMMLTTGRKRLSRNSIEFARVTKTVWFWEDRNSFMQQVAMSIAGLVRWCTENGLKPAVRLNGTSDIRWEGQAFTFNGVRYANLMVAFPNVQFYDYTKDPYRNVRGDLPRNYHLTWSLADLTAKNRDHPGVALSHGMNLAVVFDVPKGRPLPRTWGGLPVIDADLHDMRFLDNYENKISGPLIAGLRAKGKAKKDTSGFVRAVGQEDELFNGNIVFHPMNQPVITPRGR